MRYAIISDIHGNLEALNAVIEDIKTQNVDRIICLGDIISKGCHNHECIEIIRGIADAVVKGNNDTNFTRSLDEIAEDENFDYDHFYWVQKQLSADDINYIRKLPMCCEFMLSGRLVRCFHASPFDIKYSVFSFDDYNKKMRLFETSKYTTSKSADVILYGHIHQQGVEKFYGRTIINVGSVGNSLNLLYDDKLNNKKINDFTVAEYVILSGVDGDKLGEFGIETRSVLYDKVKELEDFKYNKEKTLYQEELMSGRYRFPERIHKSYFTNLQNPTK